MVRPTPKLMDTYVVAVMSYTKMECVCVCVCEREREREREREKERGRGREREREREKKRGSKLCVWLTHFLPVTNALNASSWKERHLLGFLVC
jgi:hypothetical protein